MSADHRQHLQRLTKGIEQQIDVWEHLLLAESDEHEIRRLLDGLAHLKIARYHVISLTEQLDQATQQDGAVAIGT